MAPRYLADSESPRRRLWSASSRTPPSSKGMNQFWRQSFLCCRAHHMEQLIHTLFKMHPTSSVLRIDLKLTSLAFLLRIVMDRCNMHAVMARLTLC